jgi:hypothetical protein
MPSKLQIKLLSNSGELLNVINCPAGRVCVFRGNTPADLRPYQRALIGTHGKEKLSVNVDGADYDPERHNVIGLGEAAPHPGLTVREFLAKSGVNDDTLSTLLASYGLDGTADTRCSALSPDQERRIRLLFAISQPEKALIVNEPFETITSQWKERFAELLLDFVRLKGGLVVIPSLSYRPECWIDNSLISRIEVGQSIQRTIGFGSAGSQSNEMIDELRRKLRQDDEEDDDDDEGERIPASLAVAASLGALGSPDLEKTASSDMALIKAWLSSADSLTFKIISSVLAAAVGVGGALVAMQLVTEPEAPAPAVVVAAVNPPQPPVQQEPDQKRTKLDAAITEARQEVTSGAASSGASESPAKPSSHYILDGYADVIRVSIIDTTHGKTGEIADAAPKSADNQPTEGRRSGNLYSLLEQAGSSSDQGSAGASAPPPPAQPYEDPYIEETAEEDTSYDQTEEDQRREEIRAKFLEAIRAAAERREASIDEE